MTWERIFFNSAGRKTHKKFNSHHVVLYYTAKLVQSPIDVNGFTTVGDWKKITSDDLCIHISSYLAITFSPKISASSYNSNDGIAIDIDIRPSPVRRLWQFHELSVGPDDKFLFEIHLPGHSPSGKCVVGLRPAVRRQSSKSTPKKWYSMFTFLYET